MQVYDVTPYVFEHPGGDAILNNAGGDSTKGFYGYAIYSEATLLFLSVLACPLDLTCWNGLPYLIPLKF